MGKKNILNLEAKDAKEYNKIYHKQYVRHCDICDIDTKNLVMHKKGIKHKLKSEINDLKK